MILKQCCRSISSTTRGGGKLSGEGVGDNEMTSLTWCHRRIYIQEMVPEHHYGSRNIIAWVACESETSFLCLSCSHLMTTGSPFMDFRLWQLCFSWKKPFTMYRGGNNGFAVVWCICGHFIHITGGSRFNFPLCPHYFIPWSSLSFMSFEFQANILTAFSPR